MNGFGFTGLTYPITEYQQRYIKKIPITDRHGG
jgi:hypothetical protein